MLSHVVSLHSNLNLFEEEARIATVLKDISPLLKDDADSNFFDIQSLYAYKPDIFMVSQYHVIAINFSDEKG